MNIIKKNRRQMKRLFSYKHYVKWINGWKMNRLLCYEHYAKQIIEDK
jgi:hypothetical protein